jgi:NAD(P)-dependent dehydrogenase (short-subunit alcohol dehydrogenase family)
VLTGRNADRGAQTVAAIRDEGGRAEFLAADMNNVESVRGLAAQVGDVDALVNNAAVFPFAPTLLQDIESFEMMLDVNVRAPFFLTAALLPGMIARGYGAVVNVSTVGATGLADAPVYAATKAALESLTRSWAAAFGPNGIRVNAVAPGPTHTEMAIATFGDGVEEMGAQTPLGRTARPAEIAEAIVFLASPQASYLTGATVLVDGGYSVI